MRNRQTIELLIELTRQALAGPLGFYERQSCEEDLARYQAELAAVTS